MNPHLGQATAAQAISPYPNPPEYAVLYSNEKVAVGDVPLPPPPLTEFRAFGEDYRLNDDVIRPLESAGISQLYPAKYDWREEMKKLNRSVVAAFLDLLDILIRCPDSQEREEKLKDIHTIFINMHHLINEYRPVQARDTIRLMQIGQIESLDTAVDRFRELMAEGRDVLQTIMKVDTSKLTPVPKPSPAILAQLGERDEEPTETRQRTRFKVEPEAMEYDNETSSMGIQHRRSAKPSLALAKQRYAIDTEFLNEI